MYFLITEEKLGNTLRPQTSLMALNFKKLKETTETQKPRDVSLFSNNMCAWV